MLRQLSFQFTPLYERRHRFQYTPSLQKVFQFTPLHDRRPLQEEELKVKVAHFNSCLYTRGDQEQVVQTRSILFQFMPLH